MLHHSSTHWNQVIHISTWWWTMTQFNQHTTMCGQCGTFSNLAIYNINGHLQTGRDGVLTAPIPHLFTSSIVYFDSFNQFHVHMYICKSLGAWRTVPQSRNKLQLLQHLTHQCPALPAGTGACSTKEVETGESTHSLNLCPSPPIQHSHAPLTQPSPVGFHHVASFAQLAQVITLTQHFWMWVFLHCQDLCQAPVSSGDDPDWWVGGAWYEAHEIRCKLNLCVGSPVTVAYGVSDNDLESSRRLSQRWMETLHQAMWITQSEYKKEPEYVMS